MTLRKRKGPTPAWWTLLNEAVTLVQEERDGLHECSVDGNGSIDPGARPWLRKYDRFLKRARAELLKRFRA